MKMKMMMMMKVIVGGVNNSSNNNKAKKALLLLPLYSSSIKPKPCLNHNYIISNHHKPLSYASQFRSQFQQQQQQIRCFSSSQSSAGSGSGPGPSPKLAIVQSEQQLVNSLHMAQNDRLPSVFYFTAAWCGPCKLMSPVIQDLSNKYHNVNIYKIDIDLLQQGVLDDAIAKTLVSNPHVSWGKTKELQSMLSTLKIHAVPTLYFFNNGEKAAEMVGADVSTLKKTMEDLYK